MYEMSRDVPGAQFAQGMGMLARALDLLGDVDMTEVEAHAVADQMLTLQGESRRLAAVHARAADRFATSGAWVDAGAKSPRAWVASQTNEPAGRIASIIDTGRNMRSHELMAEAFAHGEVSARHLDLLAAADTKYPALRGELYRHAEAIVELARYSTPQRFAQELEALCHSFDSGAVEKDERQRDSEAHLHLSPIADGMWRIDGLLPAEVGTQFAALLDAARRRVLTESQEEVDSTEADTSSDTIAPDPKSHVVSESDVIGIDVFGNPIHADETPEAAMDNRFTSRSNVDALRVLLGLIAPATNPDGTIALPSVNGSRPIVHLTVPIESLMDETKAAWLERFGVPSTVISATKAGLLACDATIEPMIIKDGQLVVTLPNLQTVPAHLRKAVLRRDEECRINSCTSRIDEVHHLIYLSHGGPTVMSNLAGLCWFHHHLIHHGNWTLTGDANAELTLTNTTTGEQWLNRPPRKFEFRQLE